MLRVGNRFVCNVKCMRRESWKKKVNYLTEIRLRNQKSKKQKQETREGSDSVRVVRIHGNTHTHHLNLRADDPKSTLGNRCTASFLSITSSTCVPYRLINTTNVSTGYGKLHRCIDRSEVHYPCLLYTSRCV